MIHPVSFTLDHLQKIKTNRSVDISILERSVFALALLEALVRVGMPLIFKGGTSLLLLLDTPRRLSTDIDIIVDPGTDVQPYLDQVAKIHPFVSMEKQQREEKNCIDKTHYKFIYNSPSQEKQYSILLDILYEENHYTKLIKQQISHLFLKTEPPYFYVTIPSINSILGDKLTAFAPHTTGILLGEGRELEIIKQMYDIATLIDAHNNFEDVYSSYMAIVSTELKYRKSTLSKDTVLLDTIDAAACIASRGQYNKKDYSQYLTGIRAIVNHIYGERFNAERAVLPASKVMYMASCIYESTKFEKVINPRIFLTSDISSSKYATLTTLRKFDAEAFAYVVKSIQSIQR